MESGMAVQRCIDALSEGYRQHLRATGTLIQGDGSMRRGIVSLVFDRTNISDLPTVTFDPGPMRSFGLMHESFDPRHQTITFDEPTMQLRIVGIGYDFSVSGIELADTGASP